MLCRMAFCLSDKVEALHLDNSTAKVYLCNQGGTLFSFLYKLALCMLMLEDRHSITLVPAYIHSHLNVEANYLSWVRLILKWHLLPCVVYIVFQLWVNHRWICSHPHVPINVSVITPWKILYLREHLG